jgi:hypothetical protein
MIVIHLPRPRGGMETRQRPGESAIRVSAVLSKAILDM